MTQTIQPRSRFSLNKPETENNMSHFLSLLDDLNIISKEVKEISCLLQTKEIEQIIYREVKGNENNARLFLSLFDDLNIIYETLNNLNDIIKRKKMAHILHPN